MTEAETGVMWPRAQAHLESPGAGRGRRASPFPQSSWRGFTLAISRFHSRVGTEETSIISDNHSGVTCDRNLRSGPRLVNAGLCQVCAGELMV